MAEETAQKRLKDKKGEVKGPWETLGKPTLHGLIGDPNATINVPVDQHGNPQDMNLPPSAYQGLYGQEHPAIDAGVTGGMLATGAPELMARSLLAPVARGVANAAKAAPMTTALTGGTALAAGTASPTGKTPWETMLDDWDRRNNDLKTKMGAEDLTIKGIEDQIMAKAGSLATPGTPRYERQQAQMKAMREQSKSVTDPANARKTALQQQMDAINDERMKAQMPIRQAHPWAAGAALPVVWGLAAKSGNVIGKAVRGAREAKAEKMNNAVQRTEQHIADTTTAAGGASKQQFKNTEGQALSKELQSMESTPRSGAWSHVNAGLTGTGVGAAEGAITPGAFTAYDAMMSPGGSPLQEASTNAPLTANWWRQAAPEMGVAGGVSGLAAVLASMKGAKGMPWGAAALPTERVNSLAWASRAAGTPKAITAAPKGKPKAGAQAPTAPTNPNLNNLPDL
jgi:hypothetical protein